MQKKPCPNCGTSILEKSTVCCSCAVKEMWLKPGHRDKISALAKAANPPRRRPRCCDCGKKIGLRSTRCKACNSRHVAKTRKTANRKRTVDQKSAQSERITALMRDADWKCRWMKSVRRRSRDLEWQAKQRSGSKRRSRDPKYLENLSRALVEVVSRPGWRESMADNPCWQRGAAHPSWKGGNGSEVQLARGRSEYREWRERVFLRDDYTCQECGLRGCNLHAHHLRAFADHADVRFEVSNGMTLCVSCHRAVHGRYIPK